MPKRKTKNLQGEALLKDWESARLSGVTQEQRAKELGIKYEVYKTRYYRAMANRRFVDLQEELDNHEKIFEREFHGFDRPSLFDWSLPTEWLFNWDNFVVVGDVQIPTTDYEFATLPAVIAEKHIQPPRCLIIAGDFFNFDAFNGFDKIIALPDHAKEQAAARNMLALWATCFDEIYMLTGNHERRRLRLLEGNEDLQDFIAAQIPNGRVKATIRDRCQVKTSQGMYTVLHGSTYRKTPLSSGNELAQKLQTHIISHHEHHAALGMDIYDRYFIINNGGLFDIRKMAYVQLETKAMASMSQAFTMVLNGYPYLFGKWTDWSRWL